MLFYISGSTETGLIFKLKMLFLFVMLNGCLNLFLWGKGVLQMLLTFYKGFETQRD